LNAFSKKKLAIIALDEHSHHFADGITSGGGSIDNHNDGNKIFLTATEALSEKIPPCGWPYNTHAMCGCNERLSESTATNWFSNSGRYRSTGYLRAFKKNEARSVRPRLMRFYRD